MCLTFFLHNFCPKSSLVYVLVWSPPPHTAYVITQSVFSFHNACSYHYSTFFCSTKVISSIPSLSFNSLQQQQQQPFYGPLSRSTRVSRYQKKHSPTHHPDQLLTWNSVFYLNITHPSDHSHLCSLKCHLIVFSDRPGLTSV